MTYLATRSISEATRRVAYPFQKYVLNPLDKLVLRLWIPPPGDALIETIGRRTE